MIKSGVRNSPSGEQSQQPIRLLRVTKHACFQYLESGRVENLLMTNLQSVDYIGRV